MCCLFFSFSARQVPKAKTLTKWEQFAALKGIKKTHKSRMVYDEDKQDFAPRFGHNRANDASKAWVLEHKEGKDGEGMRGMRSAYLYMYTFPL